MRTGGVMGEVVGMAASLCRKHADDPRDVYQKHLDELKQLMSKGVGKPRPPDARVAPPAFLKAAGPNLARSAQITVSGSTNATKNPPRLINDGQIDLSDNALRWLSDTRLPHWVEFRWNRPQTVSAARIVSGYAGPGDQVDSPIRDFSLRHYDGAAWKDIPGTQATGNTAIQWHAKFAAVSTDRLRLVVTGTPSNTSRIWEVELYHCPQ